MLVVAVCAIGGSAIFGFTKARVTKVVEATCESALTTCSELISKGKGEDALRALGRGSACLEGWHTHLVDSRLRDALRVRLCTASARAHLTSPGESADVEARSLAHTAWRLVVDTGAAQRFRVFSPADTRALLDVLLVLSMRFSLRKDFGAAISLAQKAQGVAANQDESARADDALWNAQLCRFEAEFAVVFEMLQQQRFSDAIRAAQEAKTVAVDSETSERVDAALSDARRGLFSSLLADIDRCIAARSWNSAQKAVSDANEYKATEADRGAIAARRSAIRAAQFGDNVQSAEQKVQQRSWNAAIRHANAALQMASGSAENEQCQALLRAGKQGLFDDVIQSALQFLQERNFDAALSAAERAILLAFDTPSTTSASAALTTARLGVHQTALAEAGAQAVARNWDAAIRAGERARKHAADNVTSQHSAAASIIAAAQSDRFMQHINECDSHIVAWRWDRGRAAAKLAEEYADSDARRNQARARSVAVDEAESAAKAAEDDYVRAVDNFIRHCKGFTADTPLTFECELQRIAQQCPKPAQIPGDIVSVLRRAPSLFEVLRNGAAVRLKTKTPFRGEPNHRVFGEFRCRCGKRWKSAATFCDKWQRCQNCRLELFPIAQRPLEQNAGDHLGNDDDRRPHDMANCERCRELGRCCLPSSQAWRDGMRGERQGGQVGSHRHGDSSIVLLNDDDGDCYGWAVVTD
jgi:hypothetical protein